MENKVGVAAAISAEGKKVYKCESLDELRHKIEDEMILALDEIEPVSKPDGQRHCTENFFLLDIYGGARHVYRGDWKIDFSEFSYGGLKNLLENVWAEVEEKKEAVRIKKKEIEDLLNK